MKIIFDKLAQVELDDASEYYELGVPRLGSRFREEVKRGIRIIREYPDAWAKERFFSSRPKVIPVAVVKKNILAIQIPGDDMINPSPKFHKYSGIRG